jgi:hypothetical protein
MRKASFRFCSGIHLLCGLESGMGMTVRALVLLILLPLSSHGNEPSEIDALIRQLGSPRFREREAASKRLIGIGEPAFEALHRAASTSPDLETSRRAARLMRLVGKLSRVTGTYLLGSGSMQFSLHVALDHQFDFEWTGCPDFNERCQGTAGLVQGWLILTPQVKRQIPKGVTATPLEFLPVTWGQRTYLLARDECLDFCNAVNQGKEPRGERDGEFCLRKDDWTVPVKGLPKLPAEWAEYLLPKPLQAQIIERTSERTGRLNVGARDGVRKGMILTAGPGGAQFYMVRVIAVDKSTCLVHEYNQLIVPVLKKGDAVSSRKALAVKPPPYGTP